MGLIPSKPVRITEIPACAEILIFYLGASPWADNGGQTNQVSSTILVFQLNVRLLGSSDLSYFSDKADVEALSKLALPGANVWEMSDIYLEEVKLQL